MLEQGIERDRYRSRISERQRRATELSIQLRLGAEETDDVGVLAEAAETLDNAVKELERARLTLVRA